MSRSLEEIGRVVEEASPEAFLFVASKDEHPPKYEYVVVRSKELLGNQVREVDVLAQVVGVVSTSPTYTTKLDYAALQRIHWAGIEDANVICKARTLGFIVNEAGEKRILMPRRAIFPGNPVYLAPDDLVEEFFSYPEDGGIYIGHLISRPRIKAYLTVNGFRRHVAIIAQTGAGKSYTVGVILEELLKKGATVIVIDPHADYVFLSQSKNGIRIEGADRIQVFRNPNSMARYSAQDIDNLNSLTFKFSELTYDEVAKIAGVSEAYTRIMRAFNDAIRALREECEDSYGPKDLVEKLEKLSETESKKDANYSAAISYARRLLKMKVFGDRTTPIEDIIRPFHISVLDLSGLNDVSQDYITYRILSEAMGLRVSGRFEWPIFIFIEEAHRFVPPGNRTKSSYIIKMIAAEGRKFGVFLTLITQRPSKIDQDVLSQCNSQIILRITNPKDQRAVQDASEQLGESLMRDLPGLNVGEAIIVGPLTRVPLIVKVRERISREGGADIDLVEVLRNARKELEKARCLAELRAASMVEDALLSEV